MAKQPWRSHYPRDWATDPFVRSLDLEARMVYFELLDIAWDEGGLRVEWLATGAYVAQRIGISRRKFAACWDRVRFKFEELSPGVQSNPRLEIERIRARKFSEKQANAAKQKHVTSAVALPAGRRLALPSESQSDTQSQSDKKNHSPVSPGEGFDFEAVYAKYPRKEGRKKGEQRFKSQITTRLKYDALMRSVENYAATVADTTYAKHFDTFMNCWEDYVDAGLLTPKQTPPKRMGNTAPTANFAEAGDKTAEYT